MPKETFFFDHPIYLRKKTKEENLWHLAANAANATANAIATETMANKREVRGFFCRKAQLQYHPTNGFITTDLTKENLYQKKYGKVVEASLR